MRVKKLLLQISLFISLLIQSTLSLADDQYYHEIDTARGATQPFWMIEKDSAVATLVLFAGGHGKLKLNQNGFRKLKKNFLVRTRDDFASQGFNIAVIDKPDDRKNLFDFRVTNEHASDIQSLIKYLRDEYKKPVWLVGTSRGTLSVANAASRLHGVNGPDGIILTSSVLVTSQRDSVQDVELEKIKVPTLFMHNRDDGCHVCPYGDVAETMSKLTKVKDKALISYQGGRSEVSNPCKALTPHGFLGLEQQVVTDVTNWIKPRLNKSKGIAQKHVPAANL